MSPQLHLISDINDHTCIAEFNTLFKKVKMVLNMVFRMTFRFFLTKNTYPELLSYRNTSKACDNLPSELNFSNIQMSEKHLSDSWATSITHYTLEALGECLQSWDVEFLFVLKVKCLSKLCD